MTASEALPPPSSQGSVVLDIGDDHGAAVVTTAIDLAGSEIEIRQVSCRWEGRHVAIRERRLPAGSVWAAVFSPLAEGDWQVRIREQPSEPLATFTVNAGKVTTVHIAARKLTASGGH
jgi:hypothetical protein